MNPTQIAAEAAKKFTDIQPLSWRRRNKLLAIFQAAIEKATEPLLAIFQEVYDEHMHFGWGYEELHDKIIETLGDKLKPQNEILESDLNPRAAHASEQFHSPNHPDYRPQDLDDGDTGVARSEENLNPPAHASEQGAWTIERIESVMRDNPSTWKSALAFELNTRSGEQGADTKQTRRQTIRRSLPR